MISKKGTIVPNNEADVEALPAAPAADCKNGTNDIYVSILILKSDIPNKGVQNQLENYNMI